MEKQEVVRFENIVKKFDNSSENAVDNTSFEIFEGEFITILGSSGSGKTTTLKMINRLIEPDSGKVYVNGRNILAEDEIDLRKSIGYVVQQIGLFPHMTVGENISVVPKLLSWEKSKIEKRVAELLDLVGLDEKAYKNRYPKELSGGQQQRVGVARALAANPKIMLLDEPFGAIDAITRDVLQKEIKKIHSSLSDKTFILVTHDVNEAFFLGTRVMIMDGGKICQFDTPKNIISNPKTDFVRELLDTVKNQNEIWSSIR